jgi:hypothetical protein
MSESLQVHNGNISRLTTALQELPDVALLSLYVRVLASSTFEGESMKQFLMTVALTCSISSSARAGDVPTVGNPQPLQVTTTSTSPGEVKMVGAAEQLSREAWLALLPLLGFLAV